jgi:PAS domain S-box-containing protein
VVVDRGPDESQERLRNELLTQKAALDQQQQELQESHAALQTALGEYTRLFDLAPVGYFVVAADSSIRSVNIAAAGSLGMDRSRLQGLHLAAFVVPSDLERFDRLLTETLGRSDQRVAPATEIMLSVGGNTRHVRLSASRLPASGVDVPTVLLAVEDVTERQRAEQALRESEARLRALGDHLPSGAVYRHQHDAGGHPRFLYVSRGIEALTGVPPAEILADPSALYATLHPEDRARLVVEEVRSREGLTPFEIEVRQRHRTTGEERWSLLRSVPSRLEDGTTVWDGVQIDITERKRVEEALRESELLYRSLFTLAPAGVVVLDESGQLYAFNDQAHAYLGYTREEFAKLRVSDIDPDEGPDDVRRHVLQIFEAGSVEFDARHRAKSGELKRVRARARAVQLGGKWRVLAVWQDVTERKQWEEALRASEERLRQTLRYASAGTWEWNVVTNQVHWSPENHELYGVLAGEVLDYARWERCVHPDDLARTRVAIRDAIEGRVPEYMAEFRVLHPTRGTRWILAVGRVEHDASGAPRRVLGLSLDISERKRAEETLQEADRRKNEFLGMLSHELRNPLAPIRNALYILDHADPASRQARHAKEMASRQVEHLTRLVDDLLDVTRVGRGKIELRRSDLDLVLLARRTAEDHRPLFQGRGLDLALALPDAPIVVNGDETRLVQVLGNLLTNARKFTPAGGLVTVSLGTEAGRAVLRVRDTGPGIPPEVLPNLFEPFTQAKQTLARSEGGLGLGLSLVKGLVALHGGEVRVSSREGEGSEFLVTIPLADVPSAALARTGQDEPAPAGPKHRRRVLIVDDNHDAAESLGELVTMLGHEVEVVYDGPSALARVGKIHPDLVLCDIGLPGMDGYQVARELRARYEGTVRLVALSGYAQPEDVARALESGFDKHVAKPPDPGQIEDMLA